MTNITDFCTQIFAELLVYWVKDFEARNSSKNLRSCTVHVDNINFFIWSTNAYNSYKTVKQLKSFKIVIVAPTCFGLHKPSSGSSQPVLRQSYNVDICYICRYLKLSILWLRILFGPVMRVDRALCGVELSLAKHRLRAPWWWFM